MQSMPMIVAETKKEIKEGFRASRGSLSRISLSMSVDEEIAWIGVSQLPAILKPELASGLELPESAFTLEAKVDGESIMFLKIVLIFTPPLT